MSSSREYYHTSSHHQSNRNSLPPIRDVVGDQLDGRYTYGLNDARGALPGSGFAPSRGDHRGPTLPPIQPASHSSPNPRGGTAYPRVNNPPPPPALPSSSSSSSNRYPSGHSAVAPPQRGSHQHQTNYRVQEGHGHAYGVLRTSGTGAFVHATPPAPQAQGILRQGGAPSPHDEEPDKRHKCEYCGKKFDRPSSLQVHVRTHTGSQPFTCDWPGCQRSFSVRSNMLRHWRSHERTEVTQYGSTREEEDELYEEEYGGSTSQVRQGGYYTTSRRK